jgi:hypothetical protein
MSSTTRNTHIAIAYSEDEITTTVDLQKLKDQHKFWAMVEENLEKVDTFYKEQIEIMTGQFHALTKHALELVCFF